MASQTATPNTSFGSSASALEERAKRTANDVYEAIPRELLVNPEVQLAPEKYVLCAHGETTRYILCLTEVNAEEGKVGGFLLEEVKKGIRAEGNERERVRFSMRDDRKPTEAMLSEVLAVLPSPEVDPSYRRRRYFIFPEKIAK